MRRSLRHPPPADFRDVLVDLHHRGRIPRRRSQLKLQQILCSSDHGSLARRGRRQTRWRLPIPASEGQCGCCPAKLSIGATPSSTSLLSAWDWPRTSSKSTRSTHGRDGLPRLRKGATPDTTKPCDDWLRRLHRPSGRGEIGIDLEPGVASCAAAAVDPEVVGHCEVVSNARPFFAHGYRLRTWLKCSRIPCRRGSVGRGVETPSQCMNSPLIALI
jgi:hypothetical protein